MNLIIFSQKLKKLRIDAGLSQKQLGERIGLTNSTLSKYENASKAPSIDSLIALAKVFHVSVDYLLGLENKNMIDISRIPDQNTHIITELVDLLSN